LRGDFSQDDDVSHMLSQFVEDVMLGFEHLSDELFNFPLKRDVSENFDNSNSDCFFFVAHEVQEP
jgi:hypothetical protein